MTKVTSLKDELDKRFPGQVMMGSEIPRGTPISSGSLALDFATGFGGFPSNRVVELYGKEGTGKTTLALMTMLDALARNPYRGALFLDLEHKIDSDWLEQIVGKDILDNRLIYLQPKHIEQATNMYRQAVESGSVCCAILDSIGGAPTVRTNDDAEVGSYGGNSIGVGAFARAAMVDSSVHDCLTIGINQVRAAVGARVPGMVDTPGGKAWKHHCTLRIELQRGRDTETIRLPGEERPVPVGYTIYGKIRKNGVGPEGRTAYWWFYNVWTEEHGFGIDRLDEIIRLSLMTDVVARKGGWYHHQALPVDAKGEHKVQGLPKLQAAVRGDKALQQTLVGEVLASLKDHADKVAPISDPEAPIEERSDLLNLYLEGGNAD